MNSMTKLAAEEAGRTPTAIPRIPLNPHEHKLAIIRHWSILLLCSCFLPVALYLILKHAAHAKPSLTIGISAAIFGILSLPSLILRTLSLTKPHSTTRPLGTTNRWALDYFNWNFFFGFTYITLLIVVSTVLKPAKLRLAALPLSLLLLQFCAQLFATTVLVPLRARYPFSFSSMPRGELARPALYTIVEDVVAVDGGQGTRFRDVFNWRYLASEPVRRLLREMDLLWGVSGFAVAVAVVVLILKLENEDVSWVIGWTIPWVWATICALITMARTKTTRKEEQSKLG